MNRRNRKKVIILLLVLFISIGFAYLSANLSIIGNATVRSNSWKVYFNNLVPIANDTQASGTASITDDTTVEYNVNLLVPGDYYEFSVDVTNDGTIDAMVENIESLVNNEIIESLPNYFFYSISYDDGSSIRPKDLLKSEETLTYKVKIGLKKDIQESDLWEDNENVSMSFSVKYIQADDGFILPKILCKRALKLHEETCKQTDETFFCSGGRYQNGDVVTYGNKEVTAGELHSGDAFTCDVDGDGVFDEEQERFYYVSDYYDTNTKSTNNQYATLIYYNNVSAGVPSNTATFAYSLDNANYSGPLTLYEQLPTQEQWKNVSLLNSTRQILNENALNTTLGGTLPQFLYSGKTARFLTSQEVNSACEIVAGNSVSGELDKCEYLLENTKYTDNSLTFGYWLETPVSSNSDFVWRIYSQGRLVNNHNANNGSIYGARPVIDVAKSRILYK